MYKNNLSFLLAILPANQKFSQPAVGAKSVLEAQQNHATVSWNMQTFLSTTKRVDTHDKTMRTRGKAIPHEL
jgi:hypothetical protein